MKIGLVSTFGYPALGVSPYADELLESLNQTRGPTDVVTFLDYQQPYPGFLYPAKAPQRDRSRGIHWAKPKSWRWPPGELPDIVHVQYWTRFTAPYLIKLVDNAKRRRARVVVTLHNSKPHEGFGLMGRSERKLLDASDAVITHIPDEKLTARLGGRHHVIPHGISVSRGAASTKFDYETSSLRPERRYILFFGNIRPYKGVDDLLKAWGVIASRFQDHDLIVAGRVWSGSSILTLLSSSLLGMNKFERIYNEACRNIPPARVHFVDDYLSEEYIDAICRVAELAVFPYKHFDAQSGAATRAAGLGKTLLVSDEGGLSQLTFSKRQVFRSSDVADLQRKLANMLERSAELVRRDDLSQRQCLLDLSWPSVASQHWELYGKIFNGDQVQTSSSCSVHQ